MKIRKGDKVRIMSGKNKGSDGVVEKVYLKDNKVLIENVNIVTKHTKATGKNPGGLIKVNRPISVSNVMLLDPKKNEPTRIGYKIVDGKKYRYSIKSGELIDK